MAWLGIAGLGLCLPTPALCHTTPAVLGVANAQAGDPKVISTSHGLAALDGTEWRFVCPERWSGPETPVKAQVKQLLWLAGERGTVALDEVGFAVTKPIAELGSANVRRLIDAGGAPIALVQAERARIVELSMEGVKLLWDADEQIWDLAFDGTHLLAAKVVDEALIIERRDLQGKVVDAIPLDSAPGMTPFIHPFDNALFVTLRGAGRSTLLRLQDGVQEQLIESEHPILGPVTLGGAALVLIDGTIFELGAQLSPRFEGRRYTCLERGFVCAQRALYTLSSSGVAAEPLFDLLDIEPPSYEGLSEQGRSSCEVQWLDLVVESGIKVPDGAPDEVRGCAASGGASLFVFGGFALWALRREENEA